MLFRSLGVFAVLPAILFVCAYPTKYEDDHAEELENEFQGDMIISQAELDAFNGRIDERLRWPDRTVPYYIEPSRFNAEQIEHIHKAAETLNGIGCVHLVERTNEVDYITVSGDATGCSSFVGRRGGSQKLSLAPNELERGCFRLYTIVHEFIHALGFHHMHSSHDRDDYVEIKWENITPGTENNFAKYGTDTVDHYGAAYDYGSVMHYSATGFSSNGQPTIVALRDLNGAVMGQRVEMTEADKLRIRNMYCPEH